MRSIGIVLDDCIDQTKVSHIFKDASNVSLFFIKDTPKLENALRVSPKIYMETIHLINTKSIDHILVLTPSQKLTHHYESAKLTKDILNTITIDIIDTKTFGPGIMYLLMCIQLWDHLKYSYQKIKDLLHVQINNNTTFVVTKNQMFEQSVISFKKLFKPLVKGYLLSSELNYHVSKIFYNEKNILDKLYLKIQSYKRFNESVHIFVYSGKDQRQAKLLQHRLYTEDKDLKLKFYGEVSKPITQLLGNDFYGIYIGYYEEAII